MPIRPETLNILEILGVGLSAERPFFFDIEAFPAGWPFSRANAFPSILISLYQLVTTECRNQGRRLPECCTRLPEILKKVAVTDLIDSEATPLYDEGLCHRPLGQTKRLRGPAAADDSGISFVHAEGVAAGETGADGD